MTRVTTKNGVVTDITTLAEIIMKDDILVVRGWIEEEDGSYKCVEVIERLSNVLSIEEVE